MFISIDGYHGDLPGPATVTTYVGDKYANGDEVYLYYYNEETESIELIGDGALVVGEGYIATIGNINIYAAYLSVVLPAAIARTITECSHRKRIGYYFFYNTTTNKELEKENMAEGMDSFCSYRWDWCFLCLHYEYNF